MQLSHQTGSAAFDDTQARQDFKRRAQALADLLNQIADIQREAKGIKAEAKALGYDPKAFSQVVKDLRKGPDEMVAQLELELVLDTYRIAADVPTDLDQAKQRAASAGNRN